MALFSSWIVWAGTQGQCHFDFYILKARLKKTDQFTEVPSQQLTKQNYKKLIMFLRDKHCSRRKPSYIINWTILYRWIKIQLSHQSFKQGSQNSSKYNVQVNKCIKVLCCYQCPRSSICNLALTCNCNGTKQKLQIVSTTLSLNVY